MIIVGLTGNIASGKTTALNFIKKKKLPTHDSDAVVTNLYKKPPDEFVEFLKKIKLSRSIKQKNINKNIIRDAVLKNKAKLRKLEQFIH